MLPWQIYTRIFNLSFMYKLDFEFKIKDVLNEFSETSKNIKYSKHFGSHHDGGWSAISLYSPTGKSESLEEKTKTKSYKTEISSFFPKTVEIIEKLKLKYECEVNRVRFMKLKSNSNITWHFDYDESYSFGNARLHIPIIINDNCSGFICHNYYRWKVGEIWYGDFSFPHKVSNKGKSDRVHLVIDLINPKNLFKGERTYNLDELKRNKHRKFVQTIYNYFYKYPIKLKNKFL